MERHGRILKFLTIAGILSFAAMIYGALETMFGWPIQELVLWAIFALLIGHILGED